MHGRGAEEGGGGGVEDGMEGEGEERVEKRRVEKMR